MRPDSQPSRRARGGRFNASPDLAGYGMLDYPRSGSDDPPRVAHVRPHLDYAVGSDEDGAGRGFRAYSLCQHGKCQIAFRTQALGNRADGRAASVRARVTDAHIERYHVPEDGDARVLVSPGSPSRCYCDIVAGYGITRMPSAPAPTSSAPPGICACAGRCSARRPSIYPNARASWPPSLSRPQPRRRA